MRYPKNIQQGGTIGFVAPSFGCQIEPYYSAFGNAQKKFREMGYQLQLGPNCYAGEGIGISNTPEKCGQELTEYYCSRENDCLISCGGGELMCETMSHVDFERLKISTYGLPEDLQLPSPIRLPKTSPHPALRRVFA